MALGTIGTDPDYSSLLAQRSDPRLLMAQKLMDVEKMPTANSTQSSFWANLLNQGARGALGGYLYGDVQADREKERKAQGIEAGAADTQLQDILKRLGGGGTGTAPAPAPGTGTAPAPRADAGGTGTSGGSAGGDLVAAVHHLESRGRMAPGIYGDGGQAAGPMQVHPGALADVNRAQGTNYTHEQLAADPELGRKVGVAYLTQLRQQFGRDDYALGAYNAGPGVMRAAIANGQGVAGLPPRTQQYVTEGLARMRGRQADAGDTTEHAPNSGSEPLGRDTTPGSNLEALRAGMDAPKPRGMQLAERVAMGGAGNTATDTPTPILSAPRVPVSSAALQGPPGPQPSPADVPDATLPGGPAVPISTATTPLPLFTPPAQPSPVAQPEAPPPPDAVPDATLPNGPAVPISTATAPLPVLTRDAPPPQPEPTPPPAMLAEKLVPVPGVPPGVPPAPSNMPTYDDPQGFATAQPPPLPPAPPPGSGPEAGPTNPNAPLPLLTPPSQGPMVAPPGSGETGGQPTIPPQAQAPVAAAGSGETGGQPAALPQEEPPLPVPPIPPQGGPSVPGPSGPQLAAPLVSATDALNTASLAAARKGETFVPGAAPSGQQLAAPLMSWAGNLGADGAPVLTPQGSSGGPTGPQLAAPGVASQQGAAPLVTPASATGDTSATGGPSKAPPATGDKTTEAPSRAATPAQLPGGLPDQATVTEALTLAARWKANPNQRVREKGMVLDTAATMAQRRLDHFETLKERRADQDFTRSENAETRRQATELALANRTPAERPFFDPAKNEYRYEERDPVTHEWKDSGRIAKPGKDNSATYPDAKPLAGVVNNTELLDQINAAEKAVKAHPGAFGVFQKVPGVDRLGTKEEQQARATVSALSNAKIHVLSGSAVGAAEDARMQNELPYTHHNQEQLLGKLAIMRENTLRELRQAYDVYGPNAGFRAIPGHARALGLEESLPSDTLPGRGAAPGSGAAQAAPAGGARMPPEGTIVRQGSQQYRITNGKAEPVQ